MERGNSIISTLGARIPTKVSTSRGCRNEKKKPGVSNTPYNGGRWITDGGWWVTDGGWCVTDGGWWVTDGSWWVATKHQRVDAIVKKKTRVRVLMAPPEHLQVDNVRVLQYSCSEICM